MTCYHPIDAWQCADGAVVFVENLRRNDVIRSLQVPCGQCVGCRMQRARDWTIRIKHEAQGHEKNCFITLTYDDAHLPADGSLRYRDFQLFMKKLRINRDSEVRFFMCGEYGDLNLRPHYHAILFGCDFEDRVKCGKSGSGELIFDSAELSRLWGNGRVSVQSFTIATAAYCARYVMKKVTGDMAEAHYGGRVPEFCQSSRRPGLGAAWFDKYGMSDVYRQDFVVTNGSKVAPPKYYDKLRRRTDKSVNVDEWEYKRTQRAENVREDSTAERLRVREIVHEAKIANLRRDL